LAYIGNIVSASEAIYVLDIAKGRYWCYNTKKH